MNQAIVAEPDDSERTRPSPKHRQYQHDSSSASSTRQLQTILASGPPWPIPESVDQLYAWQDEARSYNDPIWLFQLCCILVEIDQQLSPPPPPTTTTTTNNNISQDSLLFWKKGERQSSMDQVLRRMAFRLLKQLSLDDIYGGEALRILADCYGTGTLGLERDYAMALAYYTHASKHGHVEATYRTGVCHEFGIGTERNQERAIQFYRKAAHFKHAMGMYKYGMFLLLLKSPSNTTSILPKAVSWLERAAAAGQADAIYALSMVHLQQQHYEINDPQYALDLLHYAADKLNHVPSQCKLGEAYELGRLTEPNDTLSFYWYARAAQQRSAQGAMAVSGWYLTGIPGGVLEPSDQLAYLWARKAVLYAYQKYAKSKGGSAQDKSDLAQACYLVATLLDHLLSPYSHDDNGFSSSSSSSRHWYSKAARLGHNAAIQRLKQLLHSSASSSTANNNNRCIIM